MLGFLSKILGGNKSEKDVKQVLPLVNQINEHFQQYQSLTNDELRGKTVDFRQRIQEYVKPVDEEIVSLQKQAEELEESDIQTKDAIYKDIDELKKHKDEKLEEILKEVLPEAFAVVKETARRFTNNTELVSTATDLDKELSVRKNYITIDGDNAIYKNSWDAAGNIITWNMVHYDVQLIGGVSLHQGK